MSTLKASTDEAYRVFEKRLAESNLAATAETLPKEPLFGTTVRFVWRAFRGRRKR